MFDEPTIADFKDLLEERQIGILDQHGRANAAIRREMVKRGTLQSSMRVHKEIDARKEAHENALNIMLGELRRAIKETKLDPLLVREACFEQLEKITQILSEPGDLSRYPDGSAPLVVRAAELMQAALKRRLRQFDVGLDVPAAPMTNVTFDHSRTINARDVHAPILQGDGSTQTVSSQINVQVSLEAIEMIERGLPPLGAEEEESLTDIRADLATIKAQLRKPRPSTAILREAGASLRGIAEGAAGSLLMTPGALGAVQMLLGALGL